MKEGRKEGESNGTIYVMIFFMWVSHFKGFFRLILLSPNYDTYLG
jgi:hypothetical protein